MSSPVTGTGTQQTVEIPTQNEALSEAGPAQQVTAKKAEANPASGQSSVEAYQGPHELPQQVTADGPSMTAADLASQLRREGAERQQAKAAVKEALSEPLSQMGQQVRDPIGLTGVHFKFAEQHEFLKAIQQPEVRAAASQLSRNDVDAMMMAQVMKAWPNQPPEKAEQIKDYLMKQMGADLQDSAAFEMQKVAVKTFDEAAKSFEATAKNPDKVRELAQKLGGEGGKAIRQGIGLEDGKPATVENVSAALLERAQLLKQEARSMEGRGTNTLFRELAHHDVGEAFMEQAKIRPGSFAAEQIEAVKARGEREEQTIGQVRFASALGAAALTMGVGLVGVGSIAGIGGVGETAVTFGTGLSMMTPEAVVAFHEVTGAKAGESAGTMGAGAADAAQNKAYRTAATAVVAAGLSASPVAHGITGLGEGAMSGVIGKEAAEFTAHLATHAAIDKGTEFALEAHPIQSKATGKNALQRASQ